jgi:flavodoxin
MTECHRIANFRFDLERGTKMKKFDWKRMLAVVFAMLFVVGQLATTAVDVSAAAKKKTLNATKVTMTVGKTKQLKVSNISAGKVKWSSSKKSVATVSKTGKVTAKKTGKTTITAKFSGKSLKCKVTVKAKVSSTITQETPATPSTEETPEMSETTTTPETSTTPETTTTPETSTTPETTTTPETPTTPATPTPETPATTTGKTLVVYYSASSNTEKVANYIAAAANADIFEIEPVETYTSADLNWTDSSSRVVKEYEDTSLRNVPLKSTTVENWDSYDTVFIGYPIWWGIAAWPTDSFVKANDFTGKTVIPFCTSLSSGLGSSGTNLATLAGTGNWQTGQRFSSSASENTVSEWVKSFGY